MELERTLGLATGEVSLYQDATNEVVQVVLDGRVGETIQRNAGRSYKVVPLCIISDDVLAWIGYRERWGKKGHERQFRFVESGVTVHVGRTGEVEKPQVMRSEWASRRSRSFAGDAGHPHWQFDAMQTERERTRPQEPRFGRAPASPIDFKAASPAPADLLRRLTMERMHLASAATWWRQPTQPIAHAPADIGELNRWMLGCVSYLRQEIRRCELTAEPRRVAGEGR